MVNLRKGYPKWIRAAALALLAVASGCAANVAVEGNVTFKGEPVSEGAISFEAPDGSTPTFGGRIENGTYRIPDLPPEAAGTRLVRITASRKTGRKLPAGPPFPPSMMIDEIEAVPTRYNHKSTTTVELRKGVPNRFDFSLEGDAPR
ncbi:MAG: hypothetical protein C0467_23925 [Planctomycetaceae bacterium]|nr:hypothetical protein [Planctomycetaceae bacterium]